MHKKLGQERDRIRRLAKAWAQSENEVVVLYQNTDGTFGFCAIGETDKPIIEYITPY